MSDRFHETLEVVFDCIEDGISVINKDYEIITANKGISYIFGEKDLPEKQGAKCFKEYFHRNEICDNCPAEKTLKEGISSQLYKISRDTGTKKLVLNQFAFPVKDADGNVTHVVEYIKDVTAVAKLEEQLLSSERLVGIGKLAAGIAHEIRNPLGSIKATAQFCLSKYELDEGMRKKLMIILRSSDRVNRVVKDMLNLARPGGASFHAGCVGKVINNVCGLVNAKCIKQNVRLTKRFSRRLPSMLLDDKLLEDAFLNFMLNALAAMPRGGRLAVIGCYDHNEGELVISFIDSGCGIPEDHMGSIFDPFFTTKKDGTGLGLFLARQVVELHKGNIQIESKPGYGTEITVRLPV